MNKRAHRLILLGISLFALGPAVQASDEIVFSTAPTHSDSVMVALYTPLLDYLSEVTGKTFVMKPAHTFIEYASNVRKNTYDMTFDGPHLVSWRMENSGHVPLVRLPGRIRLAVAVQKSASYRSLDDLVGQRVCSFALPNMLTLSFLQHFPNPVRQPEWVRGRDFDDLLGCVRSGRGDAVVLREEIWTQQKDSGLRLLAAPQPGYPERTISIDKRVKPQVRDRIVAALLSEEGTRAAKALLHQFNEEKFVKADPTEYRGMAQMLRSVWGFYP